MSKYVTRSGVFHVLDDSTHRTEILYDGKTLVYVFSSELYKNIFESKLVDNRNKINKSLSNRFGFTVKNDILSDLKLYMQTEKRGFYIIGDLEFKCLDTIELNGVSLMKKS